MFGGDSPSRATKDQTTVKVNTSKDKLNEQRSRGILRKRRGKHYQSIGNNDLN